MKKIQFLIFFSFLSFQITLSFLFIIFIIFHFHHSFSNHLFFHQSSCHHSSDTAAFRAMTTHHRVPGKPPLSLQTRTKTGLWTLFFTLGELLEPIAATAFCKSSISLRQANSKVAVARTPSCEYFSLSYDSHFVRCSFNNFFFFLFCFFCGKTTPVFKRTNYVGSSTCNYRVLATGLVIFNSFTASSLLLMAPERLRSRTRVSGTTATLPTSSSLPTTPNQDLPSSV